MAYHIVKRKINGQDKNFVFRHSDKCYLLSWRVNCTLTIIPQAPDFTVILAASGYTQQGNSIVVPEGTTVNYSVSKEGYISKSGSVKVLKNTNLNVNLILKYVTDEVVFESSTAGTYDVNLTQDGLYEITAVGGGGAAYMRGVYDDRGYIATGGSGAGFIGTFRLSAGVRNVTVAKIVNNTKAQSGNTQTLAPTDYTKYNSVVEGIVTVGGGGTATSYNSAGKGTAGAAPVLEMTPESTTLNTAGNIGNYTSGGKGSAGAAVAQGGASVHGGYGKGQGGGTSEYAAKRYWINGTGGYVKIVYKGN